MKLLQPSGDPTELAYLQIYETFQILNLIIIAYSETQQSRICVTITNGCLFNDRETEERDKSLL